MAKNRIELTQSASKDWDATTINLLLKDGTAFTWASCPQIARH